jgi:HD-like signal output (HDOD) protein/CheY-like chemotaxis protein
MNTPPFRALVVDDDVNVRRLVKTSLAQHGIECDCASNGNEALALVRSKHYILAVTDLRMPHGHGHALCKTLLAREQCPIIVVLTGVMEKRLADDLTSRGVDRIYFKPVDFRVFSAEISSLVLDRFKLPPSTSQSFAVSPRAMGQAESADENSNPRHSRPVREDVSANLVTSFADLGAARQLVAVLRKTRTQSSALIVKLAQIGIESTDVDGADALRRLFMTRPISLLVIDSELDGFFTGLEVIRKLRTGSIRTPVLLISANEQLLGDEAQALGLVTLVNSASNSDEIAETARRVLIRRPDQQEMIPERAREIAERQGDLPLLSHLILRLLQYLEMPTEDVPLNELCRDVSLDPKASAVLIRAVNASANGLSREIANVPQAVRVLGVRSTIGRILNAALTDGMGLLSKDLAPDMQSWHARRSMLLASTASMFAKQLEGGSDESAFLIGMLQDLGIICLLRSNPRAYQAVLTRWRASGHLKLGVLERSEFGCTHAAVSAAMAERWQLPRSLVVPVQYHLEAPTHAAKLAIHSGLHRAMSIAEALVDLTDAPHPNRRDALDSMLMTLGAAKRSACLCSLADATAKAAEAFQLTTVPLPSAKELGILVLAALSVDSVPGKIPPLMAHGESASRTCENNP